MPLLPNRFAGSALVSETEPLGRFPCLPAARFCRADPAEPGRDLLDDAVRDANGLAVPLPSVDARQQALELG